MAVWTHEALFHLFLGSSYRMETFDWLRAPPNGIICSQELLLASSQVLAAKSKSQHDRCMSVGNGWREWTRRTGGGSSCLDHIIMWGVLWMPLMSMSGAACNLSHLFAFYYFIIVFFAPRTSMQKAEHTISYFVPGPENRPVIKTVAETGGREGVRKCFRMIYERSIFIQNRVVS